MHACLHASWVKLSWEPVAPEENILKNWRKNSEELNMHACMLGQIQLEAGCT